jgi:hypothetical protein
MRLVTNARRIPSGEHPSKARLKMNIKGSYIAERPIFHATQPSFMGSSPATLAAA